MGGNGWKWLVMAVHGCYWMELAVNRWNGYKWREMALKWLKIVGNDWKMQKIA